MATFLGEFYFSSLKKSIFFLVARPLPPFPLFVAELPLECDAKFLLKKWLFHVESLSLYYSYNNLQFSCDRILVKSPTLIGSATRLRCSHIISYLKWNIWCIFQILTRIKLEIGTLLSARPRSVYRERGGRGGCCVKPCHRFHTRGFYPWKLSKQWMKIDIL